MLIKKMAYKTLYKDIIFIEGNEKNESNLGLVKYKKGLKLYNNQLKNLDDVKEQLYQQTKELGGNAVINFKYGQKSASWFKSIFLSLDDNVNWYGEGEAVILSNEDYNCFLSKLNK